MLPRRCDAGWLMMAPIHHVFYTHLKHACIPSARPTAEHRRQHRRQKTPSDMLYPVPSCTERRKTRSQDDQGADVEICMYIHTLLVRPPSSKKRRWLLTGWLTSISTVGTQAPGDTLYIHVCACIKVGRQMRPLPGVPSSWSSWSVTS